jgi:DNA processing protein
VANAAASVQVPNLRRLTVYDFDQCFEIAMFASSHGRHMLVPPSDGDSQWKQFIRTFDQARELDKLGNAGFRFIARCSADFPTGLDSIHDVPAGLFVRGNAELVNVFNYPCVAIVGARACSGYGAGVARQFGRDLAANGVTVVSGLARGIDGEAHRGALEAGGTTVAVLGCGIDRDYPSAHADLGRRIVESGGLIVSEYAPGVEPAPWRFPARNRIIAGISEVTVVVEARERSGALITADLAMEEERPVYAVPGEITSVLSAGTNHLLQLGALPCLGVHDVLNHFGIAAEPAVCLES